MNFAWLKRSMPSGLYGRAALILLLPIVVVQLVVSIVFIQRHFEDVTEQMTDGVVRELRFLIAEVQRADTAQEALEVTKPLARALRIQMVLPAEPISGHRRMFYDLSGKVVIRMLNERLPGTRAVDLASGDDVILQVDTRHGILGLEVDRRRATASNPHQLLVLMTLLGFVMTGVAFVYLRNQLRPITRLAAAADAFGKGRIVRYKPSGAVEVRAAGNAFLDMRNRIERQIEQRTLMLSGVSHDLRTPLTRLRLEVSMLPEGEDRTAMERDLADMEDLMNAFLDFARADASDASDDRQLVDPAEIARSAVAKAERSGGDVSLGALEGAGTQVSLRSMAVERALSNLIGNSMRYANRAVVSLHVSDRVVRFTVEDDGPGIPADRREEAARPFIRLDASRNQDKGTGVGLGLSIAHDIARSHGGVLRLGDSEALGGLKAELVLAR